jgi:hypothetical protein
MNKLIGNWKTILIVGLLFILQDAGIWLHGCNYGKESENNRIFASPTVTVTTKDSIKIPSKVISGTVKMKPAKASAQKPPLDPVDVILFVGSVDSLVRECQHKDSVIAYYEEPKLIEIAVPDIGKFLVVVYAKGDSATYLCTTEVTYKQTELTVKDHYIEVERPWYEIPVYICATVLVVLGVQSITK